jgi:phage replication-related protein YjqB (UPF0714/DUF867 family)
MSARVVPNVQQSRQRGDSWNHAAIAESMREMRDREPHRSFAELAEHYTENVDFEISHRLGEKDVLCAAWHGGQMEPGSDLLAEAIAGSRYHFYAFRALFSVSSGEHPLHVTSTRFREPTLLSLADLSEMVVAVHCCSTAPGLNRIFIGGGADESLKRELIESLRRNDFQSGRDKIFPGHHYMNPCNRGRRPGIQIEVSQSYMDWLVTNSGELHRLADVIRDFIASRIDGRAERSAQ